MNKALRLSASVVKSLLSDQVYFYCSEEIDLISVSMRW
jgi:hypothetical protein